MRWRGGWNGRSVLTTFVWYAILLFLLLFIIFFCYNRFDYDFDFNFLCRLTRVQIDQPIRIVCIIVFFVAERQSRGACKCVCVWVCVC